MRNRSKLTICKKKVNDCQAFFNENPGKSSS